jgi:hypothetical protein
MRSASAASRTFNDEQAEPAGRAPSSALTAPDQRRMSGYAFGLTPCRSSIQPAAVSGNWPTVLRTAIW